MAKKPETPASPLPKNIIAQVPTSALIVKRLVEIEELTGKLEAEMKKAKSKGAIPLAQAFVVLHRVNTVMDEKLKEFSRLFERYKILEVPEVMENSGVTNVPLDIGYRVTVSYRKSATIPAESKQAAYAWLKTNYPDVLSETVNSSTLSALAKQLEEKENKELPPKLFKVSDVPQTSVTKT